MRNIHQPPGSNYFVVAGALFSVRYLLALLALLDVGFIDALFYEGCLGTFDEDLRFRSYPIVWSSSDTAWMTALFAANIFAIAVEAGLRIARGRSDLRCFDYRSFSRLEY